MKYYILKRGKYYLSEITYNDKKKITNLVIDTDFRKLYFDFEVAEEDRKKIHNETGLDLEIKILKEEE